jgi:hypothetical protein
MISTRTRTHLLVRRVQGSLDICSGGKASFGQRESRALRHPEVALFGLDSAVLLYIIRSSISVLLMMNVTPHRPAICMYVCMYVCMYTTMEKWPRDPMFRVADE